MTERIGVTDIEVLTKERERNGPFPGEWNGRMLFEGDRVRYQCHEDLDKGKSYRIVFERCQDLGVSYIEIHEVIGRGTDHSHNQDGQVRN